MKITTYLLLFILLATANATGQTLDDYLVMAAENNPGVKASYLQYQAALERVPQVGALPDPQISFSVFIMPMERYMGDQVGTVSLMQMFPWIGTLEAAKNEMTAMAKMQFEAFQETKSKLFYEVRANWYAMNLLNEQIIITRENITLLKTMEQIAMARFKSGGQGVEGDGSMIDVLRVQMEINELKNQLTLLEESRDPLVARFNQLLNRLPGEPVSLPDSLEVAKLPLPVAAIPDSIRKHHPMLKMLEQQEAAYTAQGTKHQKMGMPMIGVGLQYDFFKPRHPGTGSMNGRNMLMPMATVTIPLWRKKYAASVRESELMNQSMIAEKQEVTQQLMVNYQEALRDFNDARRRLLLYQQQTSLANQTLNILMVQYPTENIRFEEILRMQQQLLSYRLSHLDAVIDGHIAAAMIERLMGR